MFRYFVEVMALKMYSCLKFVNFVSTQYFGNKLMDDDNNFAKALLLTRFWC